MSDKAHRPLDVNEEGRRAELVGKEQQIQRLGKRLAASDERLRLAHEEATQRAATDAAKDDEIARLRLYIRVVKAMAVQEAGETERDVRETERDVREAFAAKDTELAAQEKELVHLREEARPGVEVL